MGPSLLTHLRPFPRRRAGDASGHAGATTICPYPDDVISLSHLSIAYKALGLAEDARATFEMVLRRDPDHVPALEQFALLEVEQERWAEAIATASRALTLAPTSIIARMTLGLAYVGAGDWLRAFEQYWALAEWTWRPEQCSSKLLMSGRSDYEEIQ